MAYLLHQLLTDSASKYPDKEAVVFLDNFITYSELDMESNKLAHAISELNVERAERVGIYLNRGINLILAAFGILKAGLTYVPIDPLCPPDRLNYITNKCEIKTLITSCDKMKGLGQVLNADTPIANVLSMDGFGPSLEALSAYKLLDWQEVRKTTRTDAPTTNVIGADLAYILFTSGSTGNPKGVMISHLNALTFVDAACDVFQVTKDDRFSNICPLHFDMSVFDIFVAVKVAATIIIIPETTAIFPVKITGIIEKNKISVWNSVPSALCLLATYKKLDTHDLSSLRLVLFAGEKFPLKYLQYLREIVAGARFCNMYGQTEANSSTYYWVEELPSDPKKSLPIGKTLPNFEVFLLDEKSKQITEPGQEGELYVRASTVALGYWDDVEKTDKSFVKNPLKPGLNERVYKTGDLAYLDSDGNYVFSGRKDHMLKSRGYRIEAGEIEMVLSDHPDIESAVVVPVPDELIGNRINALVIPSKTNVDMAEILNYCAKKLPKYMIPEEIKLCKALPFTASGKIDRRKLQELYEESLVCNG